MTGGTSASGQIRNVHLGFNQPEAWGLKYFASATLLSGLQPPTSQEGRRTGHVTLGLEMGWLPTLSAGQQRIGFGGTAPEDLNRAPVFFRPVLRVALPGKWTALAAAPPPISTFGIKPRLFAFGVERPLVERGPWALGWRGYGQVGSVKGAFTCGGSRIEFAPGSPENPTNCVGISEDVATLRYAGMEFQLSRSIRSMPKVVPHLAVGGNFIAGSFRSHAPTTGGLRQLNEWTHGGTASVTGGVSYLMTRQVSLTVDAFYSPLWVQRQAGGPTTNDGLFNVRALISYSF